MSNTSNRDMTEAQGVLSHVLDISEGFSDERQELKREWEALATRLQAEVGSFEKLSGTPPKPPLGPHAAAGLPRQAFHASRKQRLTSRAGPAQCMQPVLCTRNGACIWRDQAWGPQC